VTQNTITWAHCMFSQIRSLSYLIYRDFPVPQITPKLATVLIAAKVFTGFHEYRSIYFILIRQLKYFNVYQDQYINYYDMIGFEPITLLRSALTNYATYLINVFKNCVAV
jgi:hypothetical protein